MCTHRGGAATLGTGGNPTVTESAATIPAAAAPDPFATADPGQIAMMHKLETKLPVGAKGTNAFGGSGFTITSVKFKMRPDGFIEYTVTSEKYIPAQISAAIGVGDQPAKILRQTMTGRILKNADGSLKSLVVEKRKTTEKNA